MYVVFQVVIMVCLCGVSGGGFVLVHFNATDATSTTIDAREKRNNKITNSSSKQQIPVPGELKGFR